MLDRMINDFNDFLHALRTYELRSMPKVKNTMLSAGCSGAWYFNWIRSNYGIVNKHIGVEYYSPKPPGLTSEIEWVVANVQNMQPVADKSVDIIFSGQNIEHLWPDELIGFLVEANRVLKDGGLLVLDSPNREITQSLRWSHPEHTIEFTISEIIELLELSGFETITKKGIWLCRDPMNGRILSLDPKKCDNEWPVFRRLVEQHAYPEHSFCWWVEAKKKDISNINQLKTKVKTLFNTWFPERVNRLQTIIGSISDLNGHCVVSNLNRECGVLIYGPYMPLLPGKYQVEFNLRILESRNISGTIVEAQVFTGYYSQEGKKLAQKYICEKDIIDNSNTKIVLKWVLKEITFGIQFRLIVIASIKIEADFFVKFDVI